MKNGYYLSTYLFINGLANIMNIELRHDMNMSLWKYDEGSISLIKYWELERFTGLKQHRKAFYNLEHAKSVINELLSPLDLSLDDMEQVWGTPELQSSNNYHSLEENNEIAYHSICHLYSSLLSDTDIFYNENVLSFAVDGVPDNVVDKLIEDKYYYAGTYSQKGKIMDVFPVCSPGVHWGYARDYYGMREGSLMALCSASESKLIDYSIKDIYVKDKKNVAEVIDKLDKLFNFVDRLTEKDTGILFNGFDNEFSEEENKISMAMKVIHKKSLEIMDHNIEAAVKRYGIKTNNTYLCLSGGYALNCPTNSYLLTKYKFKGFLSIPCVNDAGLSLGIALYAFYKFTKTKPITFKLKDPFHGEKITEYEFKKFIENNKCFIDSITDFDPVKVVTDIKKTPIIWVQGAAEIGPRALGHRSILADPSNEKTKKKINSIKQREWWRPVAPIIIEKEMGEWFNNPYPSPYMLNTFEVLYDKKDIVPAIVHIDGSARVQSITFEKNSLLYQVLEKFNEMFQIPILCNTSLNDKGEPIINTLDEMLNFALRKDLRIVYINGKRVTLKNHNLYCEDKWHIREIDFESYLSGVDKKSLIKEYNPYNVGEECLTVYIQNPKLYSQIDLKKEKDIRILEGIYKFRKNRFHII